LVELVCVVFQQCQAETIDAAQRRAEIMRYRITESFEFFVGGGELAIGSRQLSWWTAAQIEGLSDPTLPTQYYLAVRPK
jgi:hypothetical protein